MEMYPISLILRSEVDEYNLYAWHPSGAGLQLDSTGDVELGISTVSME